MSDIHPGDLIKTSMQKQGRNLADLSKATDVSAANLSRLINRKQAITADIANRLEERCGLDALELLYCQCRYDLAQVRRKGGTEAG